MSEKNSTTSIASWTLAGPGTAPIIGDALRSVVPLVDASLVVFTPPEPGRLQVSASEATPILQSVHKAITPDRMRFAYWPWRDDYGAARNAALDLAAETGAAWGLMLDTDERAICPDPAALRAYLSALPQSVCVVLAHHEDGSHTRERFFRLPSRYRFAGRTHEMYPAREDEQAIVPPEIVRWSELPKTPEQLHAKFLRDVDMLRADILDNPNNGAAHYYLGASLQALGRHEEAIDAFREHRRIDTRGAPAWHEGTAFSCYRAAECYIALSKPDRAIDCAVAGLALDAGIAELYWIAAIASLQEGRVEQARCWAESARVHGMGSEAERRRRGFRVPRGLRDGPAEVLAVVEEMRQPKTPTCGVCGDRGCDQCWDDIT